MTLDRDSTALNRIMELAGLFAGGDYARADELFELTRRDSGLSKEVAELAESLGMMMVQIEAREYRLAGLIDDLKLANRELAATLEKVRLLENIEGHLSKFVPDSVKSLIESNPDSPDLDARDRDVSVLFLDIAGYTKLSENTERAQIRYLLERYFSAFLDDIHDNKGDINETAGDGLMIIFLDEDPAGNAAQAVNCAVSIQKKAHTINREEGRLQDPIIINIGINSGRASVGSTRFEGVSGTRWTFTATGPVTNMAARLGGQAVNGQIIIGPETHQRVLGRFAVEPRGERELKNVSKPVPVFEVLPE